MSPVDEGRIVYAFEGYRLDPSRRRLTAPDGAPVALRDKVLETLLVLVRNAGRPVAKRDLMNAVWTGAVVEENNLNQAISALRQAFGDDRQAPRFIATIVGTGYQFVAPVMAETRPAPADGVPAEPPTGRRPPRWALVLAAAIGCAGLVGAVLVFTGPRGMVEVDLDSSQLVTDAAGAYTDPTLSPDGQRVAYVSRRSGLAQIWVQPVDDYPAARPLTQGDQPALAPSWSPDRDVILFQRALEDGTTAAWLIAADGMQPARVVVENARRPRFAAGGDEFTFHRGPGEVFRMSIDGGAPERLAGLPESAGFADPEPVMSAAGDIAFVHADEGPSGHLWLDRAGADDLRQLTRPSGRLSGRWVAAPAWHPDGRHLFYVASPGDSPASHLWQYDLVTGESLQISSGVAGYGAPSVSGDGRRLAYSFSRPLWQLVATDPETGAEEILLERRQPIIQPVVSRTGEAVAFFGDQVYSVSLEDRSLRQWTFGDALKALPAWSRGEQAIYYYRERELHHLDPETGASERVLEDFHWSSYNWLAVHDDRLAFRERVSLAGDRQTVILDRASDERRVLEADVLPLDWSRDGRTLLGVRADGLILALCEAPRFDCRSIVHRGEPVSGARPRWSIDERAIFFRRAQPDRPGYAWIWRVARDGSELQRVVEVGPYDPDGMSFGQDREGRIVWNRFDRYAGSEIWVTRIPRVGGD